MDYIITIFEDALGGRVYLIILENGMYSWSPTSLNATRFNRDDAHATYWQILVHTKSVLIVDSKTTIDKTDIVMSDIMSDKLKYLSDI